MQKPLNSSVHPSTDRERYNFLPFSLLLILMSYYSVFKIQARTTLVEFSQIQIEMW